MLDGYRADDQNHKDVAISCEAWLEFCRENRRFCEICSMATRAKYNLDEEDSKNSRPLYIDHWELDEFRKAFDCPTIFDRFQENLDSGFVIDGQSVTKGDLILEKFYFAGTCARYMFGYHSDTVIMNISDAIASCSNILPYFDGTIGEQALSTVNRLISTKTSFVRGRIRKENSLVSRFAASELALKFGPNLVRQISTALGSDLNPEMEGFLFEMWFFSMIKHDGVRLEESGGGSYHFNNDKLLMLDPSKNVHYPECDKAWFKPMNWNQGGYDAVHVDFMKQIVTFFQITISKTHSLKLEHGGSSGHAEIESVMFLISACEEYTSMYFGRVQQNSILQFSNLSSSDLLSSGRRLLNRNQYFS